MHSDSVFMSIGVSPERLAAVPWASAKTIAYLFQRVVREGVREAGNLEISARPKMGIPVKTGSIFITSAPSAEKASLAPPDTQSVSLTRSTPWPPSRMNSSVHYGTWKKLISRADVILPSLEDRETALIFNAIAAACKHKEFSPDSVPGLSVGFVERFAKSGALADVIRTASAQNLSMIAHGLAALPSEMSEISAPPNLLAGKTRIWRMKGGKEPVRSEAINSGTRSLRDEIVDRIPKVDLFPQATSMLSMALSKWGVRSEALEKAMEDQISMFTDQGCFMAVGYLASSVTPVCGEMNVLSVDLIAKVSARLSEANLETAAGCSALFYVNRVNMRLSGTNAISPLLRDACDILIEKISSGVRTLSIGPACLGLNAIVELGYRDQSNFGLFIDRVRTQSVKSGMDKKSAILAVSAMARSGVSDEKIHSAAVRALQTHALNPMQALSVAQCLSKIEPAVDLELSEKLIGEILCGIDTMNLEGFRDAVAVICKIKQPGNFSAPEKVQQRFQVLVVQSEDRVALMDMYERYLKPLGCHSPDLDELCSAS